MAEKRSLLEQQKLQEPHTHLHHKGPRFQLRSIAKSMTGAQHQAWADKYAAPGEEPGPWAFQSFRPGLSVGPAPKMRSDEDQDDQGRTFSDPNPGTDRPMSPRSYHVTRMAEMPEHHYASGTMSHAGFQSLMHHSEKAHSAHVKTMTARGLNPDEVDPDTSMWQRDPDNPQKWRKGRPQSAPERAPVTPSAAAPAAAQSSSASAAAAAPAVLQVPATAPGGPAGSGRRGGPIKLKRWQPATGRPATDAPLLAPAPTAAAPPALVQPAPPLVHPAPPAPQPPAAQQAHGGQGPAPQPPPAPAHVPRMIRLNRR